MKTSADDQSHDLVFEICKGNVNYTVVSDIGNGQSILATNS